MTKRIILTLFIILSALIFYSGKIISNDVSFNTDEAYWISTAKVVPLLWEHKFRDPFWREYYGFVNFNSAKLIYGTGLRFFGINDVSIAGTAPATYYIWESYGGKPLPTLNPLYRIIMPARLISGFFASIAVGLVFVFVLLVFRKISSGLVAAFVVLVHPITIYIATHALSDSCFLFFQMILFILMILLAKTQLKYPERQTLFLTIGIGFTLAWITGVKLNGVMFLAVTIVFLIFNTDYSLGAIKRVFILSCIMSVSMTFFFLLIEPNLFFYPQYTFFQMLADRIQITNQHIVYFSRISPGHVILSLPERFHSFVLSLFPLWLCPLFIAGTLTTIAAFFNKRLIFADKLYRSLVAIGIFTSGIVLIYVVFDEPRYFLPVLPFVAIVSVNWINYLKIFTGTILKRFSHMR